MESYKVFVDVWQRGQKISRKCFEKSEKFLHRIRCWTLQKEA